MEKHTLKGYSGLETEVSEEVQSVMARATQEAKILGHDQIGTGHILLAIMAVAPDRLAVKNMSAQLKDTVKLLMGEGSGQQKNPQFSEAAMSLLLSSEVVYGDPEYEQTSRCELRRLIHSLYRRAASSTDVSGLDCAYKALNETEPNLQLLAAYAQYEDDSDLNEALRLSWSNRFKFLCQVFKTQRYAQLDEPAQVIESLVKRYTQDIKHTKNSIQRYESEIESSKTLLEKHDAELKETQQKVRELNAGISYLGAICEPEAPLDAGAKVLIDQRQFLQAEEEKLLVKIGRTRKWLEDEQEQKASQERNLIALQQGIDALSKVLKSYRDTTQAALQKAQTEARQVLLFELKELGEEKT